jgi:alkylhydroperoxidase/carboxymuconolactone decarboxylase family protein YurZ
MATLGLIEYADAPPEVRAVYDDIMATRKVDWINNFWKALAHDPATLRRTWESIKQIMAPGALDAVTKEMVYLAVSATNQVRLLHRVAHRRCAQGRHDRRAVRRADGSSRNGQRNQSLGERVPSRNRRTLQELTSQPYF